MRWDDITRRPADRTLREFAAAAAVLCAVAAAAVGPWPAWGAAGVGFALVGWRRPRWLRPLFTVSTVVTFPPAWATTWLVLAVIFFAVVTPVGWLRRLRGGSPLDPDPQGDHDSYWVRRPPPAPRSRYLDQF